MKTPTDDIHIDPSLDRLATHQPAFDFLCDLWDQLVRYKAGSSHDEAVVALLQNLESRIVATALVLNIRLKMRD